MTRERLYLDAMESVLTNTSKVLINGDSANSLMYLPIDKLIERRQQGSSGNSVSDFSSSSGSNTSMSTKLDAVKQRVEDRMRSMR